VLVMTSSNRTCSLLREYLDMLDPDAPTGEQGRPMMMRRLRGYLGWKADLHASMQNHANPGSKRDAAAPVKNPGNAATSGGGELSEAMKKKDRDRRDRAANRRRVRGGAPGAHWSSERPKESEQEGLMKSEGLMIDEAEKIADL
jgi:DNA excision repair protein ERCC-4